MKQVFSATIVAVNLISLCNTNLHRVQCKTASSLKASLLHPLHLQLCGFLHESKI
jgi:hypothetical protein